MANTNDLMNQARTAVNAYDEAIERARDERDATLRELKNKGLKQADLVRATGYTRETIRRALDPEIREAVRRAAAERRAAKKQGGEE